MNEMKSLSSALRSALRTSSSSDFLAAKAARAEKVRRMWKAAVESCAGAAAPLILDHTNSVYIIRNNDSETDVSRETSVLSEIESSKKRVDFRDSQRANRQPREAGELIVYLEDSLIAAEVDARREMIRLKFLELFGEELADFKIRVSRGKYKLNHPYRKTEAEKNENRSMPRKPLPEDTVAQLNEGLSEISDKNLRESLKRAMISDLEIKNAQTVASDEDGVL